ncbi:hypothetical protein [Sulfurimonas sp.]|uniref:hypothetical protein n=1 Tax=Sulfurimonas sp. TaxID=2022749 RepID=UPI0035631787
MKYFIWIINILIFLGFSGCGYKEGISTGDKKSYLYFTGNTHSIMVSVDDGEKFSIEEGRDNQYKIKPGKHFIKVYRANKLIVKREVFVSDGISKEIEVN